MSERVLAALAFSALVAWPAGAHESKSGFDYAPYKSITGMSCCDGSDCRPAAHFSEAIDEHRQAVVRLFIDGTWISAPRYLVVGEDAKDGRAHWCGKKIFIDGEGGWRPAHRCVILPPRNM